MKNFKNYMPEKYSRSDSQEMLSLLVGHEQGRQICLQQGLFPDVGIGVVDEGAGFNGSVGVDVQVIAAAGDTALHIS